MCGIIGAMTFGGDLPVSEKVRREATIFIITELLQLTQTRGKDATGISTLFEDGSYIGLKMGIPSIEFISDFGGKETNYDGFLKLWREEEQAFKIFLGHCRKSSVGNSWDNVNNHPIKVGDIVGVHNGTLTNYEKIFKNLACKRDGEVDSEAIFRLMHHFSDGGKNPFTEEMIYQVATRLQGSYAVLTYNGNNPYQMASFRDGKPIEMALIKPLNMVFIASEQKFLKQAVFRLNKQIHIYNTFPEELHLSESNVEYKMMIDDTMSIFDLTKEVTDETKIVDLYHSKKVERTDKIWKKETTTTGTTNTANTGRKTTPPASSANKGTTNAWNEKNKTKSGTEVNASSSSTDKDKKVIGSVWNKSMRSFSPVEADIEKAKKIKCIDIDVEAEDKTADEKAADKATKGVKKIVGVNDSGDLFELREANSAEKLVGVSTADVKERRSETSVDVNKPKNALNNVADKVAKEKAMVVDLTVDPKALELAEKNVKDRKRFESDEDMMVNLEIDSQKVLDKLPLHALANRVQRFAQKLGFYQGYRSGKEEGAKESSIEAARKFKVIAMKFAEMLDENGIEMSEAIKNRFVDKHTRKLLKGRTDLDYSTLVNMFSSGDMRNSFTLRRVVQTAKKMKEKAEKASSTA